MLSKEVKLRIKNKRVLRVLRHAVKLVKKKPVDLKAVIRAMTRVHNGAPIKYRKNAELMERLDGRRKYEFVSRVDASDEEFHAEIQGIFSGSGSVIWPEHKDEFPMQHARGTNMWLVFLRVPQPKKEPESHVEQ